MTGKLKDRLENKPPSFQFYPRQWLSDDKVLLMSYEVQGMHVRLMCVSWQQEKRGTLPNDERKIRAWLGNPENWEEVREDLLAAWPVEEIDGKEVRVNYGLLREAQKQQEFRESRRRAAKSRWDARASGERCKADANPMRDACIKDARAMHVHGSCIEDADAKAMHNVCSSSSSASASTKESTPPTPPSGGGSSVSSSKKEEKAETEEKNARLERDAERVRDVYAERIKKGRPDQTRSRAKKNIMTLLKRGVPANDLLLCIDNYADECERLEVDYQYRYGVANFFGRERRWEGYQDGEYVPPPEKRPRVRGPALKWLTPRPVNRKEATG